jgi:DNA-binding CsgD family transcriptional regulator
MATKPIRQQFFEPIVHQTVADYKYQKLEIIPEVCDKLSRINNQSIYIIDYAKQGFWYVSPHQLFLCGYSPDEVKRLGYLFYERVLSSEDLQMLLEINRMGWELFYKAKPSERMNFCISYDFYLHHKNGSKVLINHKLSPTFLTENGNIWLATCVVSYSPQKESGNVIFTQNNKSEYYTYDFENKEIIPHFPEKLTSREEEVFVLMIRGYNTTEIAEELCLSENTIRNHRSSIEKKMGVNTLSNAVSMFYSMF